MAFDWISFLRSHRVPYRDSGANTSRDNLVVHCPFCGTQDPSEHMSVNLSGKGWRCFRNSDHRGKNPAPLVAMLAGITLDRANAMVGNAVFIPDDFADRMKALTSPDVVVVRDGLAMPKEFKPFAGLPSSRPFVNYLTRRRGFTHAQVDNLTRRWGIRYAVRGSYHGRIIFPVVHRDKLVSWVGRAISGDTDLRYKALTRDQERAEKEGYDPALGAISHYVLWYDILRTTSADTIVLCEGPFDALKVCVLGRAHGVVATCFHTSQPTEEQMYILRDLLPRFKRRIVMLDQAGTFATGIRITNALSSLGVSTYALPRRLKDPGDFDLSTFQNFLFAMR